LIKPLLFKLPPESAHDLTLLMARLSPALGQLSGAIPDDRLRTNVGTLEWRSPYGLAAGLDKNAEALNFFENQGFGALEAGTLTLKPQLGNDKPRMFRYPLEFSLRNSMGFPNKGLLDVLPRLTFRDRKIPLGINIGKNKESTAEESIDELSLMMALLIDHADYFVVNVSSPNTPGLRAFQEKSYLHELFSSLNELRKSQPRDLYLKIAPDLGPDQIQELVTVAVDLGLTGLIATNTTVMPERGAGGISGELLRQRAKKVRQQILSEQAPIELIGVGGFTFMSDVLEYWGEGGKAFQIYTSYVYQGPELLKKFEREIITFMDAHKLKNLAQFFSLELSERKKLTSRYPA
jgi:dihydroorotate dehydrogenase